MRKNRSRVGPRSAPAMLRALDRRYREARAMQKIREELIAHLGGKPSIVEREMIDRAAVLRCYLDLFDLKSADAGELSEADAKKYLAYHNSYIRTLQALGIKRAPPKAPTLDEYLAAKAEREETR